MRTAALVLLLSSTAAAQVTVTGIVRYQDRTYDSTGFTGTTFRPVRQAEVELLNTGAPLAPLTTTDESGQFTFTGATAAVNTQVRIYARRNGASIHAVVLNNTASAAIYTVLSGTLDTTTTTDFGTIDILQTGAGPAFNIFDCAVKSFQYLASVDPVLPVPLPLMTLYWELDSANGTYFDSSVNGIFLLGLASDSDQYDDDIILHEMGHWTAFNFSKDDTLGGPHTIVDQLDPRTSWSEGWAHYWSATVRRFFPAEYANPNLQVDTFGTGASVFDVEGPSFPALAIMATNELAVACVLWHLTDGTTLPPPGAGAVYEPEVWRAVHVDIPVRSNITLEDFHAGLTIENPAIMPAVSGSEVAPGIFKERKIRYYPDGSEPNDSPGAAAPLPLGPVGLVQRTFFGNLDDDWYVVNATPGVLTVDTLNLGDGCNTLLQLYDASGTTLIASDDDYLGGGLASRVSTSVTVNTTFLVRALRASPVVDYGYYDLRAQIGAATLPPSDHHPYDHRCGALGLEALLAVGMLQIRRRLKC